jgi:hypothetical protein
LQAYLAAGKAAYAANRFFDAQGHYLAALQIDPTCGEPNYQMARLLVHDGRDGFARAYFYNALDLHWSFALRAASDELFIVRRSFVRKCLRVVTQRINREARTIGRACLFDLKFLRRCEDRQYRLGRLKSLARVNAAVATISGMGKAAVLKSAFDFRKAAKFARVDVHRLAGEYCNLLRAAEHDITHRSVRQPLRRHPSDLAPPLAALAALAIDLGVVITIAVAAHLLAVVDDLDAWFVRAELGVAALTGAWLGGCRMRAGIDRYLYRVSVCIAAFAQACAIEARLRANRFSIRRGRSRLRRRLRQIERRFELATHVKAGQGALS